MDRRVKLFDRFLIWGERAFVLAVGAGVLASCTVGPDYERPDVERPEGWLELETEGVEVALGGDPDFIWWASLGDEDLEWLIGRVIRANLRIEIARTRVREARALVGVAEGELLPSVGTAASYDRLQLSENFPVIDDFVERGQIDRDQSLFSAGFDASWEVDLFGGDRRAVEAAAAALESEVAQERDVLLTVVAEVARNYFELRGAQQRIEALERSIASQRSTVSAAEDRLRAGLGVKLDIVRAEADLRSLRAELPRERSTAVAAAMRLAVLTSMEGGALWRRLADGGELAEAPLVVPVGLPGDLLRRRPDIVSAERSVQAASASIGVAVADLYPTFSLTGDGGLAASDFADLFSGNSVTWSIGPSITWPIFQGGRIRANIDVRESRHERALLRYRRVVRGAIADVESSLTRYAQARLTLEHLAGAAAAQAESVSLARRAYEAGLSDIEPLLDAQRRLASLEAELAESRASVLVALASLNKALGGGWPVGTENTAKQ
jgi:outer membrane protein, multidrug efflux system